MPKGDGTGPRPVEMGLMTGRGFGVCKNAFNYSAGSGLGLGCRNGYYRGTGRGLGRCLATYQNNSKEKKSLLEVQKEFFKNQLAVIDEELKNL